MITEASGSPLPNKVCGLTPPEASGLHEPVLAVGPDATDATSVDHDEDANRHEYGGSSDPFSEPGDEVLKDRRPELGEPGLDVLEQLCHCRGAVQLRDPDFSRSPLCNHAAGHHGKHQHKSDEPEDREGQQCAAREPRSSITATHAALGPEESVEDHGDHQKIRQRVKSHEVARVLLEVVNRSTALDAINLSPHCGRPRDKLSTRLVDAAVQRAALVARHGVANPRQAT
mmetsp:Transcript_38513/g.87585  ORF Transcript_38513/g.87585 Transcript_38513/m.87585 type:complete len:229 (+) Transcript_38513:23-709(+)